MLSTTYSRLEFRMRGIYSYKQVSAPPWAIQALLRCTDNCSISFVEAKLPINWERISPKCWEAFTTVKCYVRQNFKSLTRYLQEL